MENKAHKISLYPTHTRKTYSYYPKTFEFPAGEVQVNVSQNEIDLLEEVSTIMVTSRITSSRHAMELFMILDALTHEFENLTRLWLYLPYLPYSRQDRVCADGEASGLETFMNQLMTTKVDRIFTNDVHNLEAYKEFGQGFDNVHSTTALFMIASYNEDLDADLLEGRYTLVCPDKGAEQRVLEVADHYKCNVVMGKKKRDPKTGKITEISVADKDLTGQRLLIIDDICDGGGTFLGLAEKLKEKNPARIDLYVTHGIFSKGLDVFDGLIDHIYTTNSFPAEYYNERDPRITIIEV